MACDEMFSGCPGVDAEPKSWESFPEGTTARASGDQSLDFRNRGSFWKGKDTHGKQHETTK